MEKVLEEVADKPQTEFMVSIDGFLLPLSQGLGFGDLIPLSHREPEVQRQARMSQRHTPRRGEPQDDPSGCLGGALPKDAVSKGHHSYQRLCRSSFLLGHFFYQVELVS